MLMLPSFDSKALTEAVSKQLSWALETTFGIGEDREADKEKVYDFIVTSEHICIIDEIKGEILQGVIKQLERLHEQAADPENLYSIDTEGELFLNECLKYFDKKIGKDKWKIFGTSEQLEEIRNLCVQDIMDSGAEDDPDRDIESEANELYHAMLYIPNLEYDKGHPFVLFWDSDFLFLRKWSF